MIKRVNWNDIPLEEVTPKMHRKLVYGEKIMIAKLWFKDGFVVPMHSHEHEQLTQCLKGTMRFWFGEDRSETMDLHAGDALVIPSHVPHEALMIGDCEGMDSWSPPRLDWLDGSDDYLRK